MVRKGMQALRHPVAAARCSAHPPLAVPLGRADEEVGF